MKTLRSSIYTTLLALLLSTNLVADCSFELFSISSTKGTKIIDFVEQLSDECEFSIIINDPFAEKFLNKELNKTHLKNLTIDEVFNIVLNHNNLSYTLENNILKISYLTTRIFPIDYILSQRESSGSTDITLSSSAAQSDESSGSTDTESSESGSGSTSESGMKIQHKDKVTFWKELDTEFQSIINRPHDEYKASPPIINKNAGLVTVTCTIKQMNRFERYLKKVQEKVQLQVLIDVQLLAVTMADGQTTGVDWSQLYKLQNITVDTYFFRDEGKIKNQSGTLNTGNRISGGGQTKLNEVIKFLNTQGDVSAISNPKVLTLNNQPALITVGKEYFYKTLSTETLAGGNTGTQSQNEEIQSVFSGVLLDITPEISDDRTITLKINPSVSETINDMSQTDPEDRTMPPDLERRQLSSVVTVKDGHRIILGGLINTKIAHDSNQIQYLVLSPYLVGCLNGKQNLK